MNFYYRNNVKKIPYSEANSHMSVSRSAQRCRAACPIFSDKTGKTQWTQWKTRNSPRKTYMAEKLLIPLPVPHPVVIAITIHNRDSEQPIPIDSDICREIMRAVEDSHLDLHGKSLNYEFICVLNKIM